jgi:hypothetical protein
MSIKNEDKDKGIVVTVKLKDINLWLRFKDYVLVKHGKLHGTLGEELTEAIKQYLKGGNTHAQPRSSKVLKELPALKEAVLEKFSPGGLIPKRMLEDIIRNISGIVDKRSIHNRIETLIAQNFLKRNWETSPRGDVFMVMGYPTGTITGTVLTSVKETGTILGVT